MTEATPTPTPKRELGAVGMISMLIGIAILAVTGLNGVNTAFELNLALGTSGATTPLPNNWESVIGLGAAGVLWVSLTWFGSTVLSMFTEAKGSPAKRVGILVGALALLLLVGRGVQVMALTASNGSLLAYYCTDEGSIDDVKAIDHAKQLNQAATLAVLHGARLED